MPASTENPSPASGEIIELQTVGIDIGSSTSHVMFAVLVLERDGRHLSSRFHVVERRVTYQGQIHLTPFVDHITIDVDRLSGYISEEYRQAGVDPTSIDTGAVIITGEAAMKHNADRILELFSAQAGKFVCATAGPNLEAALAAHGSGAVAHSKDSTVLNIDIGGGTTKFALVSDGQIMGTAAVSLGARLVAWDEDGRIDRVEKAASHYAPGKVSLGGSLSADDRKEMVATMGSRFEDVVADILGRPSRGDAIESLYITDPLPSAQIDSVCFSGGVSEYIYGDSTTERGDLGPELGRLIRQIMERLDVDVRPVEGGIRATIIGASQYTVQVSGNTISVSAEAVLPLRNVPVLVIDLSGDDGTFSSLDQLVAQAFERNDLMQGVDHATLGIHWPGPVDYGTMSRFCASLANALRTHMEQDDIPIILLFNHDVAGVVGNLFVEEHSPSCPVISIDQIAIEEWSYIDIGNVDPIHNVVPVVMKSLVFK